MDFDEDEYLEKTAENLVLPNVKSPAVAGNDTTPTDRDRTWNSLHRDSKPSGKEGEYHRDSFRHRERSPSSHQETSSLHCKRSSRHRERSSSASRHRERSSSRHWERSSSSSRHWERLSSRHRERSSSLSRHRERTSLSSRHWKRSSSRHWELSSSHNSERSSSRHRSSSYYRSRDSDWDRHHSGKDHRDDRVRDWDREREKERERLEREEERERSRRSRNNSETHREEEHERREKSRELRERERGWESRRFKESKEVAEPEAGLERDQRTVFAFQIALKANERDVYDFFSRAGKVRDVHLIMDRNSRRSKGVGYIEFFDALSVPMAIALSGQLLFGQPVMVKLSEAGKNLVQSNATIGGANGLGPYSGGARRLYVRNLHFTMTEEQLLKVFEPFGTVEMVQLPRDLATGFCKGYSFIQFERLEDARAAIHLNGQREIAGRTIKVSAMTDQVGLPEVGANIDDLDGDEGRGLSLNACSRSLLMQKLDRTGTVMSIPDAQLPPVGNAPVLGVPPVVPAADQPADVVGTPTECLLLKNLFNPTVETEQDFDLDIKEDVETECAKHGTVKHIFVDKNSAGHVYVRFDSTSSAMSAQRALHGRWFAGNTVTAMFLTPQNYEMRFPCSS